MTESFGKSRKGAPKSGVGAEGQVTFWGTRGTLPIPGPRTFKYGGNTSCVEVRAEDGASSQSIIMDAGSGLAECGDRALARGDREFHIFLSHVHYDHIMGLTRFKPIFRKDCKVNFYGAANGDKALSESLQKFFSHPYFPVEFDSLGANPNLVFHAVHEGEKVCIGPLTVRFQGLNHPQGATAFRVEIESSGTSVVYATDHEHGTAIDEALAVFVKNATLFLYDTTYSEKNYSKCKGWGHSTARAGAEVARKASVLSFGLFHHDPDSSDEELEKGVLPEAQEVFANSFLCREGETISLRALAENRR